MGETKSSNGVSGKKVVKKERVSKLGSYTDIVEVVGIEFTPNDRMNEKTATSENPVGNGTEDATEGKKDPVVSENIIVGASVIKDSSFKEGTLSISLKEDKQKAENAKKKAEEAKKKAEQEQEKE